MPSLDGNILNMEPLNLVAQRLASVDNFDSRDSRDSRSESTYANSFAEKSGGALRERRNGRAGKRSSKHLKMDNKKLSTKNPQLDSPEKIHTFWIKATCDSRFCVLDASEQQTNFLELTDDCQDTAPLIGTRLPSTKNLCFGLLIFIWLQNTRTPMKTRMDSSKHSEAICVRDAERNPQFSWTIFPDKKVYSPKPANGLSKTP